MGSLKINQFCIAYTTFVIIDDFYAGNKIKSRASILSQQYIYIKIFSIAVADPGFPRGGGANSPGGGGANI